MKRSYFVFICALGLAGIILSIFFFSGQSGEESHAISKTLATSLANFWCKNLNQSVDAVKLKFLISALDVPIRKFAHLCIYTMLGLITMSSFRFFLKNKIIFLHILLASLLTTLIAIIDEINQYFSGGRGSSLRDVLIDTIGGLIGCYLSFMITDLIRHIKTAFKRK